MRDLFSGQMIRQGPADGFRRLIRGGGMLNLGVFALVQIIQQKLKLFDLGIDFFGRPAKLHSPELGDSRPQALDLQIFD